MSFSRLRTSDSHKDYSPRAFAEYFDDKQTVTLEKRGKFQVYKKGTKGLHILAIHTFGSSALSWSLFAKEMYSIIDCQILAIDLRDHGNSFPKKSGDFSLQTLTEDIHEVLDDLYPYEFPDLHVIGHSLGGSIALKLATLQPKVYSITIIDGVDHQSKKEFEDLEKIMEGRPQRYTNLDDAIYDYVTSGFSSHILSASVVVPSLLYNLKTRKSACEEVWESEEDLLDDRSSLSVAIKDVKPSISKHDSDLFKGKFVWRNQFKQCEKFYRQWYEGLTTSLLEYPRSKLIICTQEYDLDFKLKQGVLKKQVQVQVLPRKSLLIHESDEVTAVVRVYKDFLLKHSIISAHDVHEID